MKNRNLVFLLSFFSFFSAHAQSDCNCRLNLDSLIQKVTKNYAGFTFKVTSKTKNEYVHLVDSLKENSNAVNSSEKCFKILYAYRSFFHDHHLILNTTSVNNGNDLPGRSEIHANWTTDSFVNYLKERINELNPIEGIWETPGYRVGVIYNAVNRKYEAVVLESSNRNWKPGMIKFFAVSSSIEHYNAEYFSGSLERKYLTLKVIKNYLEVEGFATWKKEYPFSSDTISQKSFEENYSEFSNFQFKYLNDSTVYIRIRSCELSYKQVIDSTLFFNRKKLSKVNAWILDLRGNTGGSTSVFNSITPYLYTRPYIVAGGRTWMSEENIILMKKWNEDNAQYLDSLTNRLNRQEIEYWEKHPNTWTNNELDTIAKFDTILAYPNKVAILSDKENASAGEFYMIWAKGFSSKVKIFGSNSAGFLDFAGIKVNPLPCDKYILNVPTGTTGHIEEGISYDATGYPPDIYIPATDSNWIKFVFDYWAKYRK